VTELTWALSNAGRFASIKAAMSYCGLTSALREWGQQSAVPYPSSANAFAKLDQGPDCPMLETSSRKCTARPKRRRAQEPGYAVARKLVAYLLAADRAFWAKQAERKPAA
jgi:hypothetical protein